MLTFQLPDFASENFFHWNIPYMNVYHGHFYHDDYYCYNHCYLVILLLGMTIKRSKGAHNTKIITCGTWGRCVLQWLCKLFHIDAIDFQVLHKRHLKWIQSIYNLYNPIIFPIVQGHLPVLHERKLVLVCTPLRNFRLKWVFHNKLQLTSCELVSFLFTKESRKLFHSNLINKKL